MCQSQLKVETRVTCVDAVYNSISTGALVNTHVVFFFHTFLVFILNNTHGHSLASWIPVDLLDRHDLLAIV